ncbi:MAG: type I restriction-modification system subunit M [Lachnospiraceae bacterium]|nr:type I restriction-modification system subunit M [Lachnospiraceae bacterium]
MKYAVVSYWVGEAGDTEFDYSTLTDDDIKGVDGFREELIKEIGFFLYPSQLFCNVVKNASKDENLNMTLEQVFRNIEESAKGSDSEKCFSGLFSDYDVNSNKLGATVPKRNETLVKLLTSVRDMDFGNYTDNTVDLLGDAYEFLMGMYASKAGKSGGEYFTPQEVSTLLTKLAIIGKDRVNKVYDPACGSGSLLLKSAKILGKDKVDQGYFGQELNVTTYNLCRINMFLHNVGYDKFDIANEDTLTQPMHWDEEPFEVIVSNPPYSTNWIGEDDVTLINDPRYSPAGVLAPKTKADMAFIMHMISWLAPNGTAAVVCFPGIMYRSGAEQKIRKYLVDNNFIDAIIQLPSNLFFGTGIATCIMVMKKNKADNTILFIDAEKECIKDGNSNRLTDENIDNILKYYTDRMNVDYAVSVVPYDKIVAEKYNLSVSTYVEKEDTREKIDIVQLNADIKDIVANVNRLRSEIEEMIADLEGGDIGE